MIARKEKKSYFRFRPIDHMSPNHLFVNIYENNVHSIEYIRICLDKNLKLLMLSFHKNSFIDNFYKF